MEKKSVIKINKISKSFYEKEVLNNVSFSLNQGERVGLVGANGSGKSTLVKIIAGLEQKDEGGIEIFRNFLVSYLPQEFVGDSTVSQYLRYESTRSKVVRLLDEFGLGLHILQQKIRTLSGGEKSKIFLMRISLEEYPIIILDEPTNNLDEEGLEKLESIIGSSSATFLIISHNRDFLDNTVTKVIELDEFSHTVKIYDGNYSVYKEARVSLEKKQDRLFVEHQRQKSKIEREMEKYRGSVAVKPKKSFSQDKDKYIDSFKADMGGKKNAGRLKNAKKKLDDLDEKERVSHKRPLKIDFVDMKKSGNDVLRVKDLKLPWGNKECTSFEVYAGDRFLISGRNGSGKTSLLREILNARQSNSCRLQGLIEWGVNVEVEYLLQDFLQEGVDESQKTFLEYFIVSSGKIESDARKILARFGFMKEEIFSKVCELSPGMRGRGRIALMLAKRPNVLVLDEPTNNLDIEVLEKLEQALIEYEGTVILVSHDKRFIGKMSIAREVKLGVNIGKSISE